jgi:crotonobetainyl-CoA:carnitine CoA-transferase CaiB-like acyl-CoA transferase
MSVKPLDGYRVLDLTQNVAGPLAGQVLSDLGAEVIKIEPPRGEAARHILATGCEVPIAPYFIPFNRGKRSVVLDLGTDDGAGRFLELVEGADVVLDGFRPGTLARWGLGREQMRARNPRCIYAALSGYGGNGEHGQRPAVDLIVQAESGMITGIARDDGTPQLIPFVVVDSATGHVLAQAVLAALLQRERHGICEDVSVAMYDVAVSLQATRITLELNRPNGSRAQANPQRQEASRFATSPSGVFAARDGHFVLAAYIPKHWKILVEVIDRQDLAADKRFADQLSRARNNRELIAELTTTFAGYCVEELVRRLQDAGLMAVPVNDIAGVVESPVFAENELAVSSGNDARPEKSVRTPARFSSFTVGSNGWTPEIGERDGDEQFVDLARGEHVGGGPTASPSPVRGASE